ncbi:MAG: alpha/beta fold hydrolase [FCB group bacterium]|jgi:alpha-beta hydrolase superfamily lysophospholipase|nr:alpha/beta fold hydrolase [FCB group bacterium]
MIVFTRRRTGCLLAAILVVVIGVNALAYLHARALTHYAPSSGDTDSPDKLSWKQISKLFFTGATVSRPAIKDRPALWTWYSTHTIPSTNGVNLEAWYIPRRGASAIIVMFHGYGSSKSSLLDESAAFRALGYGTLLVDLRGSGGSTGSVTTLGYREADDVAAGVDYARTLEPGKPVFVYGSSMGAVAVLRALAVKGVRPAGAVLECPFDTMLSAIKNRFRMMHVPAFPAAHLVVLWGGVQFGYNAFEHDARAYAAKVHVPVLLIGGGDDARVTVDQLKSVYASLAGPKQLEIFEDAGHGGYLKDDARRWRRIVGDFIKSKER